jgi:hypothetical protein
MLFGSLKISSTSKKECLAFEQSIKREADANKVFATKAMMDTIVEVATSAEALVTDVVDTKAMVLQLMEEFGDSKRKEVLQWVSRLPTDDHHRVARDGRANDTGNWVFQKDDFQYWQHSEELLLLWIHGIRKPGFNKFTPRVYVANLDAAKAGKTKLVSRIIDHYFDVISRETSPNSDLASEIQPSLHLESRNQALAFFYCLRIEEERRKPEKIFCSFVKQIAQQTATSLAPLLLKYKEKGRRGFLSDSLGISECQSLLAEMTVNFSDTFLVLDALDECQEGSRGTIIAALNDLVEQGLPIKILISSRRNDDTKAELSDRANISISATDNGDDIIRFVRQRISEFQRPKKAVAKAKRGKPTIPLELEEKVVSIFLQKSEGM